MATIYKATLAKEIDGVVEMIYPKTTADLVDYSETQTVKDKLDELFSTINSIDLQDLMELYYTKTEIDDMLYVPIKINDVTISSETAEAGSAQNVTVSWSINKTPKILMINGITVTPTAEGSKVFENVRSNKTFTVTAIDERSNSSSDEEQETDSKEVSLNFYNAIYYGAAKYGTINSSFIKNLSGKLIQDTAECTFTIDVESGQYIWFACPAEFEPVFYVGGFNGGFEFVTSINFTNEYGVSTSYKVYKSQYDNLGNTTVSVGIINQESTFTMPIVSIGSLAPELRRPVSVISAGTVGAMLKVAESYFNYCYTANGQDANFLYNPYFGLYSNGIKSDEFTNSQYAINDGQFVDAVINGISYENSRYVNDTNTKYNWGIEFDDTGDFGGAVEDQVEIDNKYLTIQNLGKYAYNHGYMYKIDGTQNVRAGDILFTADDSLADNYLNIASAAIVINADDTYCTVIESKLDNSIKTDIDGTTHEGTGLRIRYKVKIDTFRYGATFPLGSVESALKVVSYAHDKSGNVGNSTVMHTFNTEVQQGFYTVVCHGEFSETPYVSINFSGSTYNIYQNTMHKVGNDYYLTVYAQQPSTISVRMVNKDSNGNPITNTYNSCNFVLFKGYADITSDAKSYVIDEDSLSAIDQILQKDSVNTEKIVNGAVTMDKLSEAINKANATSISVGTVNAMLKVAESYFNYCYTASGEEPAMVYKSHTGLYSKNLTDPNKDNRQAIVCSQFVDAVLNGISYENSRYARGADAANIAYNWGVKFDDTGEFGSLTDDEDNREVEIANRYLTTQYLAKYAKEHGYLYMIKDNDDFKVRPGDVIFSEVEYEDQRGTRYLDIGHVAFVINVGADTKDSKGLCVYLESYSNNDQKIDVDGTTTHVDTGLRMGHKLTSSVHHVCGARFPMGDVEYEPEIIESVYNLSEINTENSLIHTFKEVEQGFYTLVVHGNFGNTPYVSSLYNGGMKSVTHRPMIYVSDNDYYLTVYHQHSGVIQLRMTKGFNYSIEEATLYKGYADPHAKTGTPIYSIDNLNTALRAQNITISSGTVNAMLGVAESYFNRAYEDVEINFDPLLHNGIVYGNGGLYRDSIGNEIASNEFEFSISNAQFVDAVINGISYENSRYVNDTNTKYNWGIEFDSTGVFGGNAPTQVEIENKYLSAKNLAKYAYEHGYLYKIDSDHKVRPGDVVFSGNSDNAFLGIDFAAIVINANDTHCSIIEAIPDGTPRLDINGDETENLVALAFNNSNDNRPKINRSFTYGATFPLGNVSNTPNLIDYAVNLVGSVSDVNTVIYTFNGEIEKGFYTIVAHGEFGTAPYISVKSTGAERNTYHAGTFKVGSSDYYLTIYAQYPGEVSIRMIADSNNEYNAKEVALYKGYADVSTKASEIYSLYERTEDWRSPSIYGPVKLIPGDDLNELKEGVWYCQNGTDAEQILNIPHITGIQIDSGFRLESKRMTENERYIQTLWYVGYPNRFFSRMHYKINDEESWSDWYVYGGTNINEISNATPNSGE